MKRILGTVVATVGLLAISASAMAVTIDLSTNGSKSWSRSTDANSANTGTSPPIPPGAGPANGGPCPTTMVAVVPNPGGCFRFGFAAGSSVDLSIIGSAVSLTSADIYVNAHAVVASGTVTLDTVSHAVLTGGTGTLIGDTILWTTPTTAALVGTNTIMCTGILGTLYAIPFTGDVPTGSGSNCGLLAMGTPATGLGSPIPLQPKLSSITNTTPVNPIALGWWTLDPTHTSIIASSLAITALSNSVDEPNLNQSAYSFGATVPEPTSAALVLLGLGALALRSRKA